MTRARDVADTQDNLGGAVAPYVGAKNIVINGGFDIYQRTSVSTATAAYGLDRWYTTANGSASATILTQQTTGVPNGSRYCMRVAMGASGGYGNQNQYIETSNVAQLWGRTATISLKLRRNATFAGTLGVTVSKSATVDAGSGATWTILTATGTNVATNANLPTGTGSSNWLTISFQVTVPNDGTANSLLINIVQSQVEATGAYWEVAQVQLEAGNVTTPFARAGGSIGGELALCQRYYIRTLSNQLSSNYGFGTGNSATQTYFQVQIPEMRTTPTVIEYSALEASDGANNTAFSSLTINSGNSTARVAFLIGGHASGITQYRPYLLRNNVSTAGYLGLGAEL